MKILRKDYKIKYTNLKKNDAIVKVRSRVTQRVKVVNVIIYY